jgi:hypothetical protein
LLVFFLQLLSQLIHVVSVVLLQLLLVLPPLLGGQGRLLNIEFGILEVVVVLVQRNLDIIDCGVVAGPRPGLSFVLQILTKDELPDLAAEVDFFICIGFFAVHFVQRVDGFNLVSVHPRLVNLNLLRLHVLLLSPSSSLHVLPFLRVTILFQITLEQLLPQPTLNYFQFLGLAMFRLQLL